MFQSRSRKIAAAALIVMAGIAIFTLQARRMKAADHAEATGVAGDPGADIADVFAFLDPNNNSKVILALDVEGFIVPSELLNLSFFAPDVTFRFEIENTGDAKPDASLDVTFSAQASRSTPQTATISYFEDDKGHPIWQFTAPTTVQTLNGTPNAFVVTTDPKTDVSFFAGLTDDPFYFDIVGFNRFVASVLAGTPDPTKLQRARDSFAGYNIHMIALSVPASLLRGKPSNAVIGVNGVTLRHEFTIRRNDGDSDDGVTTSSGSLEQVDRMATPAVNTALIPFPRKNEYNSATPQDDANGRFAADIVATLKSLGTNATNIGILANVAVTNGDYLRLNLNTTNTSLGEGENVTTPGYTGFPNGRRAGDDVIDTLLFFINNQHPLSDNVNMNDVPLLTTFPFFAPPHQPFNTGVIDDGTRN
jgi:hypothetical protein